MVRYLLCASRTKHKVDAFSDFSHFFLLNFARDVWSCTYDLYISKFSFYGKFEEFCYNDCKVPIGTFRYFCLEIFFSRDQWKVFTKNKLNEYSVPFFGS